MYAGAGGNFAFSLLGVIAHGLRTLLCNLLLCVVMDHAVEFAKQKKMFQKAILSLKFKFPAKNSKQQIQISSSG